jgi:hypothetical protein
MVEVTPVGATAGQLPLEQLGPLALGGDALVKLCHLSLLVLLEHGWMRGAVSVPHRPSVQSRFLMLVIDLVDMLGRAVFAPDA